jgi:hypothetical protein
MPDSEYQCYVHFDLETPYMGINTGRLERWVFPIKQTAANERLAAERASHTVKQMLVREASVVKVDVVYPEEVATIALEDMGQSPHVHG